MNKEEKIKLKEKLPRGWVSELSKRTNFSEIYVRRVLKGEMISMKIEKEALLLASEHQKEVNEFEQLKNKVL
jgi:hypothetical protein